MSLTQKIMETVVQFMPDKEPDPLIQRKHGYIGKPFSRVDGQLKVKGAAKFSAEFKFDNLAYAALVYSTIAKGRITKIDSSKAERAEGVISVITHENAPKMKSPPLFPPAGDGASLTDLPVFQDALIYWNGQPVACVVVAVAAATEKAHRELLALAGDDYNSPLADVKYEDLEARSGGLFSKQDSMRGETYESILKRVGQEYIETETAARNPLEMMKYSMHSYGAQFAEVRVNKESGEVRVSRFLGSFDCGKILNPKTATSQFRGGIIMGIGLALTEETLFDARSGRIMNPSLAEYHVPVNLDIPKIEVIYNDIPDEHAPLGAHGIGEIGITGVAAAIANAVFNATGKRIRDLPITLDKLL